jgi:FkbM family methyltransferase
MALVPPLRQVLNRYYLTLDSTGLASFQRRYAKIFRRRLFQRLMRGASAQWRTRFMERDIIMPLTPDMIWRDWDSALSITGNDIEVKQTYSTFLASDDRPDVFFDVGANYGTHSILFRSADVYVIAFEPNPTCFEFCRQVCRLNGFSVPRWENVALGSHIADVDLIYPERDTWLGSTSPGVRDMVSSAGETVRVRVPQRPLDDYYDEAAVKKLLIKIDVEGSEMEVLLGASRILKDIRPAVIFESNDHALRVQLYDLLVSHSYGIYGVPWRFVECPLPMKQLDFCNNASVNFIAMPGQVAAEC